MGKRGNERKRRRLEAQLEGPSIHEHHIEDEGDEDILEVSERDIAITLKTLSKYSQNLDLYKSAQARYEC